MQSPVVHTSGLKSLLDTMSLGSLCTCEVLIEGMSTLLLELKEGSGVRKGLLPPPALDPSEACEGLLPPPVEGLPWSR
jgi:hypothetical protein